MNGADHKSAWRKEAFDTLRMAAPLAASNVLQMAVYAIDVIFVARLGEGSLAAASLSVSLMGVMMWSMFAMTGAVSPLIAADRGRGLRILHEVRRSARMSLWLALTCAMVVIGICSQGESILLMTGQKPDVARMAGGFLTIAKWSVLPMMLDNTLRSIISALGRPFYATAVTVFAIGVNAAGNYALVFGHWGAPALGLQGSALANVITATAAMLAYLVLIQFDRKLRRHALFGRLWRPDWARLGRIVKLGLPIALHVAAEAGLFSAAAFVMGRIGEAELAAHALAIQIASFAFMLPMGIGQAATIRVGYFYGAGDRAGMGRAGWCALAIGLGIGMVTSSIMVTAPRLVLSAYVDVTAADKAMMVALASRYLLVAAAFQLADAAQTILAGALRGLQDTRVPMTIALAGYWPIGFGVALLLGLTTPMRGFGVWVGLAMGLAVVSACLLWRWARRDRLGLLAVKP
jgi:MATE family multidrug resistance protein